MAVHSNWMKNKMQIRRQHRCPNLRVVCTTIIGSFQFNFGQNIGINWYFVSQIASVFYKSTKNTMPEYGLEKLEYWLRKKQQQLGTFVVFRVIFICPSPIGFYMHIFMPASQTEWKCKITIITFCIRSDLLYKFNWFIWYVESVCAPV